mmetsp:Transcript_30717/g.44063  ORF Transcript_30717/g.44063 Transcript_30717/m.44063 type:complete len:483 (-) Transcript_30717:508-1956(-)
MAILESDLFGGLSSFCNPISLLSGNLFPLNPPEYHLPWVWDAVYDPIGNYIEIVTVSRQACNFNHKAWHRIVELYPQYASQLGGGAESNILVPVESESTFDFVGNRNPKEGILGKCLQCVFFNESHFQVASHPSQPLRGDPFFSSLSTIQVRCPPPAEGIRWTQMALQRTWPPPQVDKNGPNRLSSKAIHFYSNQTEAFSVCGHPRNALRNAFPSSPPQYRFNLSICSATMAATASRAQLVEWMEFHRLAGVQHFFLYDTSLSPRALRRPSLLSRLLGDYIAQGLLTVVPWPFSNCARNFASGSWVLWLEKGQKAPRFNGLQPPRAIAQTAALASCLSRFKSSSRYLLHLDVDEFLAVTPRPSRRPHSPGDLAALADKFFQHHLTTPALIFSPVQMYHCSNRSRHSTASAASDLPRIHRWRHANLTDRSLHNTKLLMRSIAVAAFFVHYVSALEDPGAGEPPWTVPHRSVRPSVTGSSHRIH